MRVRALLIAGLASMAAAAPAQADTWNVTSSSDATTPACNVDLHTCVSLRTALAASEATKEIADIINVPAGTININNDLVIQSDITVNGASARTTIINGGAKYRGFRVSSTGNAKINHLTITNAAGGQGGIPDGGGILNLSGVVQLTYVRVTASQAAAGGSGGGIANVEGTMTMAHSLIDNNTASNGGGVANLGGVESPDRGLWGAVDSTIFKNTSGIGGTGGIDSRGGTFNIVILNRVTVADNVGGARGIGGLGVFSGTAQVLTSLFARNLGDGVTVNCDGTLPANSTNNVEDTKDCGFDLGSVVPGLATTLSSAGGELDVLALTAASPAVDHAPVSACSAANTSDQRDMLRPQGPGCDSGAYELDQAPTMTITSGPSGTINVRNASFAFSTPEPGVTVQCRLTGPGQAGAFATCSSATAQAYAGLADGSYTFSVRALDGVFANPPIASQSFVVDATLDTTITGGPSGPTNDTTPTFTFTGSGGAASFQCRFDTAAFAACTSPFTPTAALTLGAHTFEVRALSAAGAPDATPASRSFTVDTVAPDTTITGGPSGTVNSTSAAFTYTSTESPSTFQCALDGAAFGACPAGYTGLAQGSHTFQVRASDAAGNVDASPASRTWIVDTVAPDTTITAGPTGSVNSTSATFTYTSTESPSTFQCALDGAAFGACPAGYTGLAQGSHTFQVRAGDAAGNVDASPASRTWIVDTVAPDTTITAGPTGTVNSTGATFTYTSTESPSTFQCALDGAAFGACPAGYTGLSQGSHTFQVRAVDQAGNVDGTPASRTWAVDTVTPNTTIDSGPPTPSNDTTPTFAFSSNEAGTFQCRVDTAAFATCTTPLTTASLAEGTHTFDVRAIDLAGNIDATPATRTFVIDTTAPNTTITALTPSPSNDTTPTFSFASSEANSTFECRIDTAAFAACSSAFTSAALAAGTHTFDVRATDQAGNTDSTPASQTFVIDLTAPNTTLTPTASPSIDTTPTFAFSSEAGATFQCRVDTAAFAACTSPLTTAALTEGTHTFDVRATDTAGNTDATPASQTFVIDLTAPNTTLTPIPSPNNDTTPTFSFSSEAGATFQCRVDAAAFAACGSPFTTATLTDGTHTFDVRAIDIAGNVDATPASQTFVIDTSIPDTTITDGPGASTNDTTPTFTFTGSGGSTSFQCRIDGAAYAACTSPFTTAVLSAGSHTVDIRALNAAQTPDPSPATRTFVVDLTPPDTTLTPSASPTNDTTPTFSFSSTEIGSSFECRVDGAPYTSCSSAFTTAALTAGSHTFDVRATDLAGNLDATPASQTFMIDLTAPETTITAPTETPSTDTTPTFGFSSETGAAFQCRIDAAAFAQCTTPFTSAVLGEGTHSFEVRAIDTAGNVDPTPASQTFVVDTSQPPAPDLGGGPSGPTSDSNPSFSFFSPQTGVTFECSLDNATFAPCTSPMVYNGVAPGQHTFSVRTVDAFGPSAPTTRTFTVTAVEKATPTPTPSATPGPIPPKPIVNQTVVVEPAGGTILVRAPGAKVFVPLSVAEIIKLGSEVDARKGKVKLSSQSKAGAAPETAIFYDGLFLVTQKGGITELRLSEKLTGCKASKKKATAAAKKPKTRKLWGDGKGKFRTRGQYSAATIRGTKWLVQDTCTTTLTKVTQGVVSVNDFAKKKTVLVKKGKSYIARPKKR